MFSVTQQDESGQFKHKIEEIAEDANDCLDRMMEEDDLGSGLETGSILEAGEDGSNIVAK